MQAWRRSLAVAAIVAAPVAISPVVAAPRAAADLPGAWDLSVDTTGDVCRVLLRPQKFDEGDFVLGMPPACRHAMPELAKLGRWALDDPTHLTLEDPVATPVLRLEARGDVFVASQNGRVYTLTPVAATGRSAAGFAPVDASPASDIAAIVPVARKHAAAPSETVGDLAGRYAVMRGKHDTGCMVTLDNARIRGGERAQLAPGCRDQGIVIFDPTGWQIVGGELVLTARAGHKTHLLKDGVDAWAKDPKDGGKPLGLKKL